ncbi:glycoside hydrolase family 31 protein [Durotheca rogersii]|uniref:glycoside hydrolase family 31 protein n=1 Tax=Durotheca rogersii TaxID=419775 RepID=UPI00221FF878|nr:glycoside hydrolase family 31 protein [Durotheca rogersii]KAI5865631.1 glycoside hydrolase family 31 protein [Durotheca rogersii]
MAGAGASQLSPRWMPFLSLLAVLCFLATQGLAVKENDFKKCSQSGFCKRNRAYADNAIALGPSWQAPYKISSELASFKDGQFQATILKTIDEQGTTVRLPLTISFLKSGTARVTVDEQRRQEKDIELRHNSQIRKERYNEAEKWAIVGGLEVDTEAKVSHQSETGIKILYGPNLAFEADIKYEPYSIEFKRGGATHIKLNDRGLMNLEHWRPKIEKPTPEKKEGEEGQEENKDETPEPDPTEDESTWWEESFGGNTDTKPRGPESVALDITFFGYEHVYGIPGHTGPLSLKETRGGEGNYAEPYRLYNSDVFEYILDSPMTLYGAIPIIQAQRKDSTVGVFWLNGAETWIDITKAKETKNPLALGGTDNINTRTHWISETGQMDVFVFLGPTPHDITKNYAELTGTTAMPQEFSIAYHQCRWNYVSDDDVKEVDRKMDRYNIPYDVIWLDLEYTDDRRYFTWDSNMFKDPISMGKQLDNHGRKLVTLIDPHIKNVGGYQIADELKSKGLAVKNKDGKDFDGWCWPGSSHWIDAFNPAAVKWWSSLFNYDRFKGTMENTFIWNDMNEPSVFNGPEVTMPKDNIHYGNWEHRDLHNINGMTFHGATYQGLLSRKKGELRRPFVLTRSYFAGSQRFGAMWTGDNQASWEHLGAAFPMIISHGVSGFPFSGADVGGFFGNPEPELLTRWYQAGAFYPFFRAHAHIDSRRREPFLLTEPYRSIVTSALRLRYSLLPAWYTEFYHANQDGSPILRPLFWTHPSEEAGFGIDDQFFVGSTGLLVKPVVEKDKATADIYIPDDEVYYDYFTYKRLPTAKGKRLAVEAPLEAIPLLLRGGHIVPRRDTPRRSSQLMKYDDYTLVVAVGKDDKAEGELYADDGDSFDYEKGQYLHRVFKLEGSTLASTDAEGRNAKSLKEGEWLKRMRSVFVDKVVIVGAPPAWSSKTEAQVESEGKKFSVPLEYHQAGGGKTGFAILKRVGVRIGADWTADFS